MWRRCLPESTARGRRARWWRSSSSPAASASWRSTAGRTSSSGARGGGHAIPRNVFTGE